MTLLEKSMLFVYLVSSLSLLLITLESAYEITGRKMWIKQMKMDLLFLCSQEIR